MSDNVRANKIQPALTDEEWQSGYASTDLRVTMKPSMSTAGYRLYVQPRSQPLGGALGDARDLHALAALCLYQQPFGFTSDDVGLCESVARDIVLGLKDLQVRQGDPARDEEQDWACDTLNRRLRSLASRIQALLPPPSSESER